MEFIMDVLFSTEWGSIIVGAILLVAFLIYIFKNPEK